MDDLNLWYKISIRGGHKSNHDLIWFKSNQIWFDLIGILIWFDLIWLSFSWRVIWFDLIEFFWAGDLIWFDLTEWPWFGPNQSNQNQQYRYIGKSPEHMLSPLWMVLVDAFMHNLCQLVTGWLLCLLFVRCRVVFWGERTFVCGENRRPVKHEWTKWFLFDLIEPFKSNHDLIWFKSNQIWFDWNGDLIWFDWFFWGGWFDLIWFIFSEGGDLIWLELIWFDWNVDLIWFDLIHFLEGLDLIWFDLIERAWFDSNQSNQNLINTNVTKYKLSPYLSN